MLSADFSMLGEELKKVADAGALLRKMGLDVVVPDSGCCWMAGSFGFKVDKYDVSQRIANMVLLPTIAQMPEDALLIADGFSCREQIHQNTGRRAMHTAEVLAMAIKAKVKS